MGADSAGPYPDNGSGHVRLRLTAGPASPPPPHATSNVSSFSVVHWGQSMQRRWWWCMRKGAVWPHRHVATTISGYLEAH